MLSGLLLDIAMLWPRIDRVIGQRILTGGHRVHLLSTYNTPIPTIRLPVNSRSNRWRTVPLPYHLVTFPVRRGGRLNNINLSLIKESCKQLTVGIDKMNWTNVVLPMPELASGDLDMWARATKVLHNSLDDRVMLVKPERQDDGREPGAQP